MPISKKGEMRYVTLTTEKVLMDNVDKIVYARKYKNRSQFITQAIEEKVKRESDLCKNEKK